MWGLVCYVEDKNDIVEICVTRDMIWIGVVYMNLSNS